MDAQPKAENQGPESPLTRDSLVNLVRSPAFVALFAAGLALIWQNQHQGFHTFTWPPLRSLLLSLGLVNYKYSVLQWFGLSALSYFLFPALLWILVIRRQLREAGLRAGKWREGLLLTAICVGLMLPILFFTSRLPDFQRYYPLFRRAGTDPNSVLLHEAGYALYFFSWEFIFRGFLLFALAEAVGPLAIPIQALPFALMHLGKPWIEVYSALFAGLILGAIALRTRSMLPCFLIHWLCALALDLFVLYL